MAKASRGETITNATIDYEDGTITEYLKDIINVYKIDNLLARWDGIENISISFSVNKEIPSEE